MSELDVREVKLQLRYPESRQEDITDAYMRGYKSAVQVTDKLIARLNEENEKLRNVAGVMAYCMQAERDCDGCKMNGAAGTVTEPAGCDGLLDLLRELGVIA